MSGRTYGAFFDWIEEALDPVLFASLLRIYCSHDLSSVEGDLLGRFFEIFAQKVNKTSRRELGQYYTPSAVVRFMWHIAYQLALVRTDPEELNVLDPGMGSGTFLSEGARTLGSSGVKKFWTKLTGFDIAGQVLGIAHVNLYLAILSQLDRSQADEVGDIQLYATDALDYTNGHYLRLILPLITEAEDKDFIEQRIRISTEAKRQGAYTLVIGNPPYKNNSALTLAQVAERFPALFETSKLNARAQERNPRDDYAWFFGAADYYVGESGLICFVVSDSFARLFSYRYFRQDLQKLYHVRLIVRLGESVFVDVGPRISFAIVLLEKRATALTTSDSFEAIPYADMRITEEVRNDILGTDEDPRFQWMERIIAGDENASTVAHVPTADNNFSLYPASDVLSRGTEGKVPIYERNRNRIFIQKWPGIITAFDDLLKAETHDALKTRLSDFYALANRKEVSEGKTLRAVEEWGLANGIAIQDIERLLLIAKQVRIRSLPFDEKKIRKTNNGAMPNMVRWYPPSSHVAYIYYEPILEIPRNEYEGKAVGWGSMQQWRDARSHTIIPKLVYTTGTKSNYGLKAFVLHDEWCVKIHGGTSQQYHYTGLHSPLLSDRTDQLPNNLSEAGHKLLQIFRDKGLPDDSVLFFIAGIYNAEFAAEFMEDASGRPLGIAIPTTKRDIRLTVAIVEAGKTIRDMLWLVSVLGARVTVNAKEIEGYFDAEFLVSLGLVKLAQPSKRFLTGSQYQIPTDLALSIGNRQTAMQAIIDKAVADLYA